MKYGPGVWFDHRSEPGPGFGPQLDLDPAFELALGDGSMSVTVPGPDPAFEL